MKGYTVICTRASNTIGRNFSIFFFSHCFRNADELKVQKSLTQLLKLLKTLLIETDMSVISPTIKYDPSKNDIITFAGGCFWGTERLFKRFYGHGVDGLKVGYGIGQVDDKESLSYEQVCSGEADYAEVLQVSYHKGDQAILKSLCEFFFKVHDPTSLNSQGDDHGRQYRSAIFYHDESQVQVINKVIEEFQPKWDNKIVTVVEKIMKYFDAEDYHQDYSESDLANEKNWIPCETHFVREI